MSTYGITRYGQDKYGPARQVTVVPGGSLLPTVNNNYLIDPFAASAVDYKSVLLTWSAPVTGTATPMTEFRLLSNRWGFPVDQNDGNILLDVTSKPGTSFLDQNVVPGQIMYYGFYINTGTAWVRAGFTACLVPVDYDYASRLWSYLPQYLRDTSDNELTASAAGNQYLWQWLQVAGFALDYLKTQYDFLFKYQNDPMKMSMADLGQLAGQLGMPFSAEIPAYYMRKAVDNWATVMGMRGSMLGITDHIELVSGYGADVHLANNIMLENDQSAPDDPNAPAFDASIPYRINDIVTYPAYPQWVVSQPYIVNNYVMYNGVNYQCIATGGVGVPPTGALTSSTYWSIASGPFIWQATANVSVLPGSAPGIIGAPGTAPTANTGWTLLYDTQNASNLLAISGLVGGVNTWEVLTAPVGSATPNTTGVNSGTLVEGIGIRNPLNWANDWSGNSFRVTNESGGTVDQWFRSVSRQASDVSSSLAVPDPQLIIEHAIPVPQPADAWNATTRYGTGALASYNGRNWLALRASTGATPPNPGVPLNSNYDFESDTPGNNPSGWGPHSTGIGVYAITSNFAYGGNQFYPQFHGNNGMLVTEQVLSSYPTFNNSTTGWTGYNGAITNTTLAGSPFANVMEFISSVTSPTAAALEATVLAPIAPSSTYGVFAWVYSTTAQNIQIGFDVQSSAGYYLATPFASVAVAANTWTLISTTQTTAATYTITGTNAGTYAPAQAVARCGPGTASVGNTIYVGGLFLTQLSSGNAGAYSNAIPMIPGATYTASGWVNTDVAVSVQLGVNVYDASGSLIAGEYTGNVAVSPGGWQKVSITFQAPSNAVHGNIVPQFISGATQTSVMFWDMVKLTLVSTPEWEPLGTDARIPLTISAQTSQDWSVAAAEQYAITPFVEWYDNWGNLITRAWSRTPTPGTPGMPSSGNYYYDSFYGDQNVPLYGRTLDTQNGTWYANEGSWTLDGNGNVFSLGGASSWDLGMISGVPSTSTYAVTFSQLGVVGGSGPNAALVFWYTSWYYRWAATTTGLYYSLNGTWTLAASYTTPFGAGDRIYVVANNSATNPSILVYRNVIAAYNSVTGNGLVCSLGGLDMPAVPALATAQAVSTLPAGTYEVQATYITGAGESLPSPVTSATVTALAAPTAAPTATTATTGGTVLAGTYKYYITYLNSAGGETTPNTTNGSITTTGSTSTISVPAPASPPANATQWKLYMTAAGGSIYYLQGSATAIGTAHATITAPPTTTTANPPTNNTAGMSITIPSPAAATNVTGWRAYVSQAGGTTLYLQGSTNTIGTNVVLTAAPSSGSATPPTVNTSGNGIPSEVLPTGTSSVGIMNEPV